MALNHRDDLTLTRAGTRVIGCVHVAEPGKVFVGILAPFGQSSAELPAADEDVARQVLHDLYDVCLWAERNARELLELDADLHCDLDATVGLLDDEALSVRLRALSETDPGFWAEIDRLSAENARYHELLEARAHGIALELACPRPAIAAAGWADLSAARFYVDGRLPLGD